MSRLFTSKRFFAVVAGLFAVATFYNSTPVATERAGTGLTVTKPVPIEMQSGPTLPPGPWDEGKRL